MPQIFLEFKPSTKSTEETVTSDHQQTHTEQSRDEGCMASGHETQGADLPQDNGKAVAALNCGGGRRYGSYQPESSVQRVVKTLREQSKQEQATLFILNGVNKPEILIDLQQLNKLRETIQTLNKEGGKSGERGHKLTEMLGEAERILKFAELEVPGLLAAGAEASGLQAVVDTTREDKVSLARHVCSAVDSVEMALRYMALQHKQQSDIVLSSNSPVQNGKADGAFKQVKELKIAEKKMKGYSETRAWQSYFNNWGKPLPLSIYDTFNLAEGVINTARLEIEKKYDFCIDSVQLDLLIETIAMVISEEEDGLIPADMLNMAIELVAFTQTNAESVIEGGSSRGNTEVLAQRIDAALFLVNTSLHTVAECVSLEHWSVRQTCSDDGNFQPQINRYKAALNNLKQIKNELKKARTYRKDFGVAAMSYLEHDSEVLGDKARTMDRLAYKVSAVAEQKVKDKKSEYIYSWEANQGKAPTSEKVLEVAKGAMTGGQKSAKKILNGVENLVNNTLPREYWSTKQFISKPIKGVVNEADKRLIALAGKVRLSPDQRDQQLVNRVNGIARSVYWRHQQLGLRMQYDFIGLNIAADNLEKAKPWKESKMSAEAVEQQKDYAQTLKAAGEAAETVLQKLNGFRNGEAMEAIERFSSALPKKRLDELNNKINAISKLRLEIIYMSHNLRKIARKAQMPKYTEEEITGVMELASAAGQMGREFVDKISDLSQSQTTKGLEPFSLRARVAKDWGITAHQAAPNSEAPDAETLRLHLMENKLLDGVLSKEDSDGMLFATRMAQEWQDAKDDKTIMPMSPEAYADQEKSFAEFAVKWGQSQVTRGVVFAVVDCGLDISTGLVATLIKGSVKAGVKTAIASIKIPYKIHKMKQGIMPGEIYPYKAVNQVIKQQLLKLGFKVAMGFVPRAVKMGGGGLVYLAAYSYNRHQDDMGVGDKKIKISSWVGNLFNNIATTAIFTPPMMGVNAIAGHVRNNVQQKEYLEELQSERIPKYRKKCLDTLAKAKKDYQERFKEWKTEFREENKDKIDDGIINVIIAQAEDDFAAASETHLRAVKRQLSESFDSTMQSLIAGGYHLDESKPLFGEEQEEGAGVGSELTEVLGPDYSGIEITGSQEFIYPVRKHFKSIQGTESGRELLDTMRKQGVKIRYPRDEKHVLRKEGSRTYYKSKTDLETGVITFDPWNPMSASSTDALAGKPWLKRDASIVLFHEMRHLHLHNNPVTITAYEKRVTTEGNRLMSEHLVAGVDYTDEYGIMYHFSDSEWMRRFAQGPKGLSENDYRREFYGQRNEKPVLRMAYSGDGDSDDMAYTDITVTSTVTSREAWDPSLQQAAKTYPGYRLNSIYGKNKQYEIYEQKRKVFHELPSRIRSGFTLQEKLFINDYRHWSVRKQAETIAYFRSTKIKPWFDSPGNLDMYFYKATLNVAFSSSLINAEDVKKVVREAGGVEAFAEANGLPVVGRDAESNIRKAAEIRAKALAYTRLIDEEKRGIYSVAIQNALERAVNDQRLSLEARKCAQDALNGVVGVVPLDARRGRSSVYKASNAFFIPSEIPDGNRHAPDGNYHTGLLINLQSSSNPYVMISSPEDVPVAIKRNFLTADRPDGNTYYGSDSAVQGIRDQEGGHLYDCGRILDLAEMADELVTRTDNSFEMGERGENVVPVLALAELHRDVDPLADDGPYSDVDAGFRSEFADVHKKLAAIFYGPYSKNVKEDTYNGNIKYWNTQLTSCNGEGAKQGITRLIEIATDALKALKDNNGQQAKILFNIPYSLERERVNDLLGSHSPQEVEDLLTVPPASPENVLALHYLLSGEAVRSHPFAPIITDFQVDTAISNHLIEAGLDPKGKINAYHPAEWHDDIPEDLKRNSSHWKEDIDAFRAELIAAGYTGLFNDQDFDEVYIRRTITTLGGTSEITKGRVYVYRGLDGKEALYSPSKLLVYIDRKDNKQITKVVQSEDINSFKVIAQKLGINMARKTRGFYNKPDKETWELLLPRKKILTAVEVSKHNFDAVFPFTRSEMANKYFSMDPEPWFRKNQNKKFGTLDPENRPGVNRSFIERVFKSRLQQLPYMEIHADSDDIRQTIRNRLKEFVSGSRKASIGSPFSPRNTDTLYIALSSEESEGYSGLMVNVLRGQVIPIPRDLKQLNDLFRTPEFIQNFQSGVPGSDVESAYLDIKPVDGRPDRLEGNSITHVQDVTRLISVHNLVTSPATVLKAIEYCERTPRRVSDEEILRCRLRPSLVEAMKESVKRYFQLFAMGVIKPTDNQVRYALTLYDRATTLPGRSDDRTLFDTVSTEYNHKDMPLELLEATHYKIASEFDYQTSSKHERELQAQLDVLSTPLRLTGYAMAIGLSVLFPGVAPGIICGVMTTFLTSTTLKIIKTTITDSVEQRNALVSGIIKEMLLAPVQEAGGAGLSKMLGGRFAKLAASLKKAIVGNMGEGALELVSKEAAEKLSVGFVTKTILALEKVPAGVGTWIKQTLVLTVISESVLGIEKAIDNDDITGNPLWQLVREVIVLGLTAGVNEASSILDTPFHRWEAAKTSANQDALITLVRESAEAAGLSKEATDTLVRNMIREGLTIRDLPRETELVNTLREISESMIIVDQVYGQEGRNPNVRRVVPLYEGDSRGLVALTDFNENSKTTIDGEDSAQHANKDLDELERARNEFERAGNELDNESRELERILEEIEGSDGQAEDFSNGGREQGTQQNRVGTIPKTQIPCSSFTNKRGRSKFGRVRNGVFETSKDGNDWKKGGKTSEQLWRKARGKNENVRATGDSSLNAKVVEQHSLEEVKGDLHGQRVEPVIQGDDSLTVKEVERHPIEEVEVDLEEQRAALDSSLFLDDPKNHPQKEEESLQGHPFVGIAGGLLGLGYEAYKHRNPQARPLDSKPDESYGDKQASKVLDHLDEKKREFSVTDQIKKNLKGRAEALDHVAHGDIPILGTVADGAQTVLQVTEFAVSGDVKELDKTKLATAGAKDVYNNVQLGIEGLKKAGKVAHAGVTITEEKMNEMKKAQQDAIELGKDTAVVGLSTGAVIGGGLDALGRIAPHPVAKVGLIGLGAIFKFSGLAHAAEGLENIGGKAADAVSHELATELKSDIQQANKKHREIAFLQLGGFTPKE